MSSRLRTVTIAVIFGVVATLGVASYINSVRAAITESGVKKAVFQAVEDIPAGTPIDDLTDKGLIEKIDMPKRYVAGGAVDDLEDYQGQVIVAAIGRGEQVTSAKLKPADQSEVAYKLTVGMIAIAVPVDDVTGVGGKIKEGDRVVVLATFAPGPGGADISRVLLKNIEVLAVDGKQSRGTAGSPTTKRTITLAVSPSDGEKLVFAEEKGEVWIGLRATRTGELPATSGQTMESVFK